MSPDEAPCEIKEWIVRILGYLLRNPDAKDTVDGIERWWLADAGASPTRPLLDRAIEILQDAGWLVQMSAGGRRLYAASAEGLEQATAFLEQKERCGNEP
jgi:hypothetical protein